MREIKTVIEPIEHATKFDMFINCLLSNDWELKQRKIITMPSEITEASNTIPICCLYAELERNKPIYPEEVTI